MSNHLQKTGQDMHEAIPVPIELGVPLPNNFEYSDLKARVDAACATARFLQEHGAEYPEPTRRDKERAAEIAAKYATDEEKASKELNLAAMAKEPPQVIMYAKSILDEYGMRVADNAAQIRHYVTTKLIIESENADPRIRMKALELLGKISDVGLFADKTEVTVTHQTSDELRDKLRAKLEKLVNPTPTVTRAKNTEALEAVVTADDPELDFSDVPIPGEYEEVNG